MTFALATRTDIDALASRFARDGAVSIPRWLDDRSATALATELAGATSWIEIFRAGEKVYEMSHADYMALPADQKDELRKRVEDAARAGLQYRYRAIRVSENAGERAARGLVLDRFADLLNAPATIELLHSITAMQDIAFADAQATDYRAGDFLTTHDDAVEGKNRLAAYVFGLTGRWQADWGGLLLFESGTEVRGFVPGFNVLRVFSVPAKHHVSYVPPWVEERRLSVTGWLRAG
jgi:Rps23 Pro-64 3,4-dihydroxylase Tpa1-like proline 4-hydroxylase